MSNSSCTSKLSSLIPLDLNSNDGKLMFAAIISLLIVISFVLLLHAYARWVFLLGQSAQNRRRAALSTTTITTRLHHHLNTSNDQTNVDDDETDGLDRSVIASIPTFVHKTEASENVFGLECVICLSVFEDGEIGRHLPNCNHAFHVQCIDKWLNSHSSCPICRALVGWKKMVELKSVVLVDHIAVPDSSETIRIHNELSEITVNHELPLGVVVETPSVQLNAEGDVQKYSPSPPQLQFLVGYSLKRLLSMSKSEHKVFPSSSSSSSSSSSENELNI